MKHSRTRYIPISKLLHDSAEDSGWYSLPIFHSLLWQNLSVPPLSVSRCQQFPSLRVHIPLFSATAVIQTFRDKLMCQNRNLLLFICTSYGCTRSADRSVFLFLRKLWKWPANHSCILGHVSTGSQIMEKKNARKALQWAQCILCTDYLKIDVVGEKLTIQTGLRDRLSFFHMHCCL